MRATTTKIGHSSGIEAVVTIVRTGGRTELTLSRGPRDEAGAVSDMARGLARLMGRVDEWAPDPARAAQVEILRNAVASGRYQPDLRQVARKLLGEVASELGGRCVPG